MLVNHPLKTQLLALGLGGVGSALTSDKSPGVQALALLSPILLVQALRRHELHSIQEKYDRRKRKRLRELDEDKLLGKSFLGGSSRLGAVNAFETMRKRKYQDLGSLSEAGDAIQLAAGAVNPTLYYGAIPVVSGIDNGEADRMINKRADFSEQRNVPSLPLYLAAALAAGVGQAGASKWAHGELFDTKPLPKGDWRKVISDISGTAPVVYSADNMRNAHYWKPRNEIEAAAYIQRAEDLGWENLTPKQKVLSRWLSPYTHRKNDIKRMLRYGVISADSNAGAPMIAHEAGHAKIEETPGVLRTLQRHVYPHSKWIAPLAGAGSMAAGLASGSTLKGALLGTGIGALSGIGTVGPEMGASWHAGKGLAGGQHNAETKRDLIAALSTYVAGSVLPSTLAGAAGGYISGRRKKNREEEEDEQEKSANAQSAAQLWKRLSTAWRISRDMGLDAADRYTIEHLGKVFNVAKRNFYKHPDVTTLGVKPGMRYNTVAKLMKGLPKPPPVAPQPVAPQPVVGKPVQATFDFLRDVGSGKKGINDFGKSAAHPALPGLIDAKAHSDEGRYVEKNRTLSMLMRRDPDSFVIDSDDGNGIVGITHVPTGFRIHMLKHQVEPGIVMQKAANSRLRVLDELRRLVRSPMSRDGLFGATTKAKANKGDALWVTPRFNEESGFHSGKYDIDFLGGLFGRHKENIAQKIAPGLPEGQNILAALYARLGRMGGIDSVNTANKAVKKPKMIFDIDGSARETAAGKGIWDAANMGRKRVDITGKLDELYPGVDRIHVNPTTFRGDKLREAKVFTDINKTRTLAQIFPGGKIPRSSNKAREIMERHFGPSWIVKAREGLASADTNLTDKATGRKLLEGLREAIAYEGGASKVIAQRRAHAKEVGPIRKWIDRLFPEDMGINMRKKEYRVHAVNGKVVPYATYGRGNTTDYARTLLNPFRSREVRRAEAEVQKALNKVKGTNDRRNASYGFDVGIDKNGKPFIVETNPSEGGIASSWFSSPFVADATVAATRGRLPGWVKARNSVYGAGLGTAGLAATLGGHEKSGSDDSPNILGRLALGGIGADTAWNSMKLYNQAGEMEKLHNRGIKAFRDRGLGTADKARFLQNYADHAGVALNRRLGGIPVHWLLSATTPSADATVKERLRHLFGKSVSPTAGRSLKDSQEHYRGFSRNPRLSMLREIMTDDPTAKSMTEAPTSSAAKAVNKAMAGGEPSLRHLFGGDAYKDKQLSSAMDKRFSEFFLGGQKKIKGLNLQQAKSWGLTPYAKAIRPAAGAAGILGAGGLIAALAGL